MWNILEAIDNAKRDRIIGRAGDHIYVNQTYQLNPISKHLLYRKILRSTPEFVTFKEDRFDNSCFAIVGEWNVCAVHLPFKVFPFNYSAEISNINMCQNIFSGIRARALYEHLKQHCKYGK